MRDWRKSEATEEELYRERVYLHRQLNATIHKIWQGHRASGNDAEAAKWEKQWFRLHNCQSEWIGYRADCCKGFTAPLAVPIGCNHRLCTLCCWHRSQKARRKVKSLFPRLTHPVMITLTVPNTESIRKHHFTLFRQRVRQFIAQHKSWIRGGVYSLETTYNRQQKTWHLHAHILIDASSALPTKDVKIDLAGRRMFAFTAMKLRLEFDWLRLWGTQWGKKKATPGADARNGEIYTFEKWVRLGRDMALKEWRDGAFRLVLGVSEAELALRTAWNAENRRVIDVRPVLDRDGAAREVLKYITKVAAFSDLPEAVEPFCNAVRGARLIQTFGSWYGVKLEDEADPENPESWSELKCKCGLNIWKRMGVFFRSDVEMDEAGRWWLKAPLDHRCRGTVPRPTIRALESREGDEDATELGGGRESIEFEERR